MFRATGNNPRNDFNPATNSSLTLSVSQHLLQRLENHVRVDVQNGLIGLTQARAQFQSAVKARTLQAETLDAERKKLELGASTVYNVIAEQQALEAFKGAVTRPPSPIPPQTNSPGPGDK